MCRLMFLRLVGRHPVPTDGKHSAKSQPGHQLRAIDEGKADSSKAPDQGGPRQASHAPDINLDETAGMRREHKPFSTMPRHAHPRCQAHETLCDDIHP